MNFTTILHDLNYENLKPVYLIQGEQDYLIERLKNKFISLIPKEEREMNYANYDMDVTAINDAINDALSAPFFGERRIVMISNPIFLTGNTKSKVKQDVDVLLNYLKTPMETTTLVIIAPYDKLDNRKKVNKLLNKKSVKIDLSNFSEFQMRKYVKSIISKKGYQIDRNAMELLITKTGGSLSLIMNELPKILLFCQKNKKIDAKAVDELITNSLVQNVFDLINLVLSLKSTDAIDLYHNLLISGQAALQINAILLGQFRLLIQVMILFNQGYTQGSLATSLKVHPYRIKLAIQTIRGFKIDQLQLAYLELFNVESKLKSATTSPELLFEMFMIKFANYIKKG